MAAARRRPPRGVDPPGPVGRRRRAGVRSCPGRGTGPRDRLRRRRGLLRLRRSREAGAPPRIQGDLPHVPHEAPARREGRGGEAPGGPAEPPADVPASRRRRGGRVAKPDVDRAGDPGEPGGLRVPGPRLPGQPLHPRGPLHALLREGVGHPRPGRSRGAVDPRRPGAGGRARLRPQGGEGAGRDHRGLQGGRGGGRRARGASGCGWWGRTAWGSSTRLPTCA
jgi:hypothetical protein